MKNTTTTTATASDLIDVLEDIRRIALAAQNASDDDQLSNPHTAQVPAIALKEARRALALVRQAQHRVAKQNGYDLH